MKKKNNAGLTRNIVKIFMIIPAIFSLTANLISHVRFEALLMKKQIVCLMILAMFFFVLLFSVWLCGIGVLVMYLHSLDVSMMMIAVLTFIINLLLLIIVSLLLVQLKIDPTFPETRKAIKEMISL
jgi:hypothetical protein